MFATPKSCANSIYYGVGLGVWEGQFDFEVTSWRKLWAARIGLVNLFLVVSMAVATRLLGKASIWSHLEPVSQTSDTVRNDVRITKFGVTMYILQEEYRLNSDCRQVWVRSRERFGPAPFLFNRTKEHPAEILEEGMHAVYYIPLLGADWVGDYRVHADKNHIRSVLTCPWGEAEEVIERAGQ